MGVRRDLLGLVLLSDNTPSGTEAEYQPPSAACKINQIAKSISGEGCPRVETAAHGTRGWAGVPGPWSSLFVVSERSVLNGEQAVMCFRMQNTAIAPERNERRLCRKGMESVRSSGRESKGKKVEKGAVALCSGFYL